MRVMSLLYGVVCYLIFFATFLYAIGFIGNFVTPTRLDGEGLLTLSGVGINVLLLGIFAVQHSVMARPAFKRFWTRFVPVPVERSTYVLLSSIALITLFAFWQPIGVTIWQVTDPTGMMILYGGFAFGWALVLLSTFLINHFDLFGLRQVWLYFRQKPYKEVPFVTPGPYKLVRHPLYLGWLFAFWCTPTMTLAHLLFAIATTAYILIAIRLEERDLKNALGQEYRDYCEQVPMILPSLTGRRADPSPERH